MSSGDDKGAVSVAFLFMVSLVTMLCIFLYFEGGDMGCCEKILTIVGILAIAVFACFCICRSTPGKKVACTEPLYVDDAGIFIVYGGKKKPKICRVQYYKNVADMDSNVSMPKRIFITADTPVDNQLFDWLNKNGYEFSVANPGPTIIVHGQKKSTAGTGRSERQGVQNEGNSE